MSGKFILSIQDALELTSSQLLRLIARAPHTYKIYTIPKKSGGTRTIAQPAKETKYIQYWLIDNVFKSLPVHECAAAYKADASIKNNASMHKSNSYISKFDFKDFFTSIKEEDLLRHFSKHISDIFSIDDIKIIARMSCIVGSVSNELYLSIGAPSSPILSNSVMYDFDLEIDTWCKAKNIIYSRYADDLAFSTNEKDVSSDIEPLIRDVIKALDYPKLRINDKKTIHLSKKHQRRITGVVINNDGNLSIGRSRKRMISALIHRFSTGQLSDEEVFNLQGLLGFSKDIEPEFIFRMRKKYGAELISTIFQIRMPVE